MIMGKNSTVWLIFTVFVLFLWGDDFATAQCNDKGSIVNDVCSCTKPAYGNLCDADCVDGIWSTSQCQSCGENGGSSDLASCACLFGYSGDLCTDVPCNGQGTYSNDVNDVNDACTCDPGYSGGTCEIMCSGGGRVDEESCVCDEGRVGNECEGKTFAAECNSIGTYFEANKTCLCGTFSEPKGESCHCLLNARPHHSSPGCECLPGYYSHSCGMFSCKNGGSLSEGHEDSCDCSKGYSGIACEILDDIRKTIKRLRGSAITGIKVIGDLLDNTIPDAVLKNVTDGVHNRYTLLINQYTVESEIAHLDGDGVKEFLKSFAMNETIDMEALITALKPQPLGTGAEDRAETESSKTAVPEKKTKEFTALNGEIVVFVYESGGLFANGVKVEGVLEQEDGNIITLLYGTGYLTAPNKIQAVNPQTSAQCQSFASLIGVVIGVMLISL
eukprot:TRINITY_DN5016_c1_g1_i4.p1 TRINITY_DN5016_c1_g1~~TRINITY_DN5016_c1_g1_i4.p1  ORF type:complete len:444 (+),score=37.12 TRINITY_DN5016_c1_g1_i4:157-1488(+)